jgi:hypothetical protein
VRSRQGYEYIYIYTYIMKCVGKDSSELLSGSVLVK